MFYFGTDKDAALEQYMWDKPYHETGRIPPPRNQSYLTVKRLGDTFLSHKNHQVRLGEISQRSFDDYESSSQRFADYIGKEIAVESLQPEHLLGYRQHLAKTCGAHALGNQVQRIRVLIRFAFENGLIDRPVRFGEFKRPAESAFWRSRSAKGERMFEPPMLWKILGAADCQMRAMILLGLNCGFGNSDVGTLQMSVIDLDAGWIDFPRPKTGIPRRCPLWGETIAALRESIEHRKEPTDKHHSDLLFITKYRSPWYVDGQTWNPVSAEFRKLLVRLKAHRPGLSFYTLRHNFQTIADELGDYVATRRIMGHADPSISDNYRKRFPDVRLRRVVDHVHSWLYPRPIVLT